MKFQSACLQSRGNRIPNLLGLHLFPTMHDGIIGIPFERRLRIMLRHPSIKGIVQEKISQQGANDTTLWGALVTWDQLAVFLLHRRLQPALNVENNPFLLRVFLYRPHHQIIWDVIEETLDVQVNDPVMPPTSLACSPHRIQGRLPRAIPERIRMEQWV